MISIFRQIRRTLMEKPSSGRSGKKTRSYLIYAIGEIALVMIGILLALQVNNWNEERKEIDQEQRVIQALHNELSENLSELKYDITRLDTQVVVLFTLFQMIGEKELPKEQYLDSLISYSFGNITWNPSSYVLNDLKNSGQISRLSDQNLQLLLFGWERHYENLEEYKVVSQESSHAFIEYLRTSSSLRNIDHIFYKSPYEFKRSKLGFNNLTLLKELEFENIVDDKLVNVFSLKDQYVKTVGILEELLEATKQ